MKRFLLLAAAAVGLSACVVVIGPDGFDSADASYISEDTGEAISGPLPEIVKVKATEGTHVIIRKGDDYHIALDDRASEASRYVVSGETLQVKCAKPCPRSGSRGEVVVTVPTLDSIAVSTGAEIEVADRFPAVSTLSVSASTGGELDARNLMAADISASVSTGGEIELSVSEHLTASASTGGSVYYWGQPEDVDVSKSTGGTIRHKN